jgi:hypothetical protein
VLVCERAVFQLCYHQLAVDRVVFVDVRSTEPPHDEHAEFDVDVVAREIGRCDLLLSLVPWSWPHVHRLAERLRPEASVGLGDGFDLSIPRSHERHAFDFAFAVPRLFDASLEVERFAAPPQLDAAAEREAAEIVSLLPPGRRVLAVHVETEERKAWPPQPLAQALPRFLSRHPAYWALTLGLRPLLPPAVTLGLRVATCESLALEPSIALVRHADAFLGVDSCMLHAADLFRVPGVGLFGPTRASEFGFRLARHRHVDGAGTMAGVTADAAVDALDELLAEAA